MGWNYSELTTYSLLETYGALAVTDSRGHLTRRVETAPSMQRRDKGATGMRRTTRDTSTVKGRQV